MAWLVNNLVEAHPWLLDSASFSVRINCVLHASFAVVPFCSSHRKQLWDLYNSCFSRDLGELVCPKGMYLRSSSCDASACWIPTRPFLLEKAFACGNLRQRARLGSLLLCWGQQRCFTPSLPGRGK